MEAIIAVDGDPLSYAVELLHVQADQSVRCRVIGLEE
jgi:hypothetical protein